MPYRDQSICHCKHINAWTHLCFTTSLVYKYHLLSTQNKKIGTIIVLNNDAWNDNISICRFPFTYFLFNGHDDFNDFQYALLLLWPSYVARGNSFNYRNSIFYVIHASVVPYSLMVHSLVFRRFDSLLWNHRWIGRTVMSFRQTKF